MTAPAHNIFGLEIGPDSGFPTDLAGNRANLRGRR